eukprot:GHVL01003782.1.p1 GENE.GHVL01003782.1~~GHVL01003782.1.p1  ORF type:complete len:111 (+),score=18.14 GHVL01003782.1:29-361(+)
MSNTINELLESQTNDIYWIQGEYEPSDIKSFKLKKSQKKKYAEFVIAIFFEIYLHFIGHVDIARFREDNFYIQIEDHTASAWIKLANTSNSNILFSEGVEIEKIDRSRVF